MIESHRFGLNIKLHGPNTLRLVLVISIFLIALIPLALLIRILETTGADSISNDYLRFVNLADRVLSSGYDWHGYLKDTFDNNVHSYAFLFPVRLVLAELTHLSVMAEIYLGLVIASLNVLIFFSLLTRLKGFISHFHFILLPIISAFIFSYSQISTYSYGETALQMGFTHLGILIGIWMILIRPNSIFTPWVVMISGTLSSFSGGSGLLAWPVFLLSLLLTNSGSLKKFIGWITGAAISVFPYLAYSSYSPFNGGFNFLGLLTIDKFITSLGLPLANNINYGVQEHPKALISGLIGIGVLLLVGLLLLLCKSKHRFQTAIPAIIIIFWGMVGAVQITASRQAIAPWYTSTNILFWIGLLGLCFELILPDTNSPKRFFYFLQWDNVIRLAGIAGFLGIIVLFIRTNHTYEDKSFYLFSRSPTSAACLRNYQISPTYCEGYIFQWGVGNPTYVAQMGSILDKYHWSVLGPHQEWTLQGDYIFGNVSLISPTENNNIQWVFGESDQPSFWSDYHHLNLLLSPGQSILWQLDLPQNLHNAQFQLGFSLTDKTDCQKQNFSVSYQSVSNPDMQDIQEPDLCNFVSEGTETENLLPYAGKRLVIRITNSSSMVNGKPIRLIYPSLLIDENPPEIQAKFTSPLIKPINTDLSPNFLQHNLLQPNLIVLESANRELQDLVFQEKDGLLVRNGPNPLVRFTTEQPVCLVNFSRLYFEFALTDAVQKKKIGIGINFRNGQGMVYTSLFDFSLLAGESIHAYSMDLEILGIPLSDCITGVDFQLSDGSPNQQGQWLKIGKVGFLP